MQIEPVAPGVVKAILEGRMDAAGASRIDLQFNAIAGSHRGLIAEMSGVDFLASMGMRTLMLAAKMMQRRGGMLVLLAPRPDVLSVLEATGVLDILPVVFTADEAKQRIGI